MSKCKKIKKACKICLGPVKQKNGLQCQGACQGWVHYTCLNYTPGKVKDVLDGVIKVTCPCPDCTTTVPKELLRDPPYCCNNVMCPANNPPSCEEECCQANEVTASRPPPVIPVGTLVDCGDECIDYLQTTFHSEPSDPCMQGYDVSVNNSQTKKSKRCCGLSGCCTLNGGSSGGSSGGAMMPSLSVVQQMCNTVDELTNQINELMAKMKQTDGDRINYRQRVIGNYQQNCPHTCAHSGPRDECPTPCLCSENAARRQ